MRVYVADLDTRYPVVLLHSIAGDRKHAPSTLTIDVSRLCEGLGGRRATP